MYVVTRQQLLARGVNDRSIRQSVQEGRLTRVTRGRYVSAPLQRPEDFHRELALATPLPAGGAWAFETAAILLGLPVASVPDRLHCLVPGSGRSWARSLVHVHTGPLQAEHVTTRHGVPITTPARTVVDVARLRPFVAGVITADAALFAERRATTPFVASASTPAAPPSPLTVELTELASALGPLRGIATARRVVAFASPWAESPGESRSRVSMEAAGLPTPVLQCEVRGCDGSLLGRADFGWPELGTLGEYDGRDKYWGLRKPGQSMDDVLLAERRREWSFADEGWAVARWGSEEAMAPLRLRDKLRAAFERASVPRALAGQRSDGPSMRQFPSSARDVAGATVGNTGERRDLG